MATWDSVIQQVLAEASTPLSVSEIWRRIQAQGLYESDRKNPEAKIKSIVVSSIKNQANRSPYEQIGEGVFRLKKNASLLSRASRDNNNGSKKMTRDEVIQKILAESSKSLDYQEIAERIEAQNLLESSGKTSIITKVNVTIRDSIRKYGEKSPYQEVEGGRFTLATNVSPKAAKTPKVAKTPKATRVSKRQKKGDKQDVLPIISSFGLKWEKDGVNWDKPVLLGMRRGKNPINFWEQRGIYLLHDSEGNTVYVGQSGLERKRGGIGTRLSKHADKRSMEWDTFSWFGFCPITGSGVGDAPESCRIEILIPQLEAIFIAALRSSLKYNDKMGDGLRGCQYEQYK